MTEQGAAPLIRGSVPAGRPNRLVGNSSEAIAAGVDQVLSGRWPAGQDVPLWDGRAAVRIADIILARLTAAPSPKPEPSFSTGGSVR